MSPVAASRHFRGLLWGLAVLLGLHALGTLVYRAIGGSSTSWIDAFYMTFITIATIGFSEVIDLTHSPAGRIFTIGLAVVGISATSYVISSLVALLIDGELNAGLRRRRMQRKIGTLKQHYIVCGVGRVGANVADELDKTGRAYVVLERDREVLDRWLEHHPETLYLHEDAAEDQALLAAGLEQAAGVFAVTGDDSHNLVIAMSVKLIAPQVRAVVRLHDIRNANKAKRAGADEIVSPDFTGGMRIASAMLRPHVVSFMDRMLQSDAGLRMEEVPVPQGRAPCVLAECLPRARSYLVVAIHEAGAWEFNPSDQHLLCPGMTVVIMATPDGRSEVERRLANA